MVMAHSKDLVPPVWKKGGLSYSTGLAYDTAKKMIEAAMSEARGQGLTMVIAVADAGGNLVAFGRMDEAMLASIHIAIDKAFTAAYGKIPTQIWRDIVRSGNLPPLFIHERWTAFPGGFPLMKGKKLLGGIGCSGATAYGDTSVARAGLRAGGFNTEDADAILKELNKGE
jgi:cob(I)alamin adenosyltransferase